YNKARGGSNASQRTLGDVNREEEEEEASAVTTEEEEEMPTQKECIMCKKKIGVASRTCAHCGAKQPYKQKLENIKRKLSHGWKERQKKNREFFSSNLKKDMTLLSH
ncbi:hypothetical protein INR49_018872, partial [Caranx melampygus]